MRGRQNSGWWNLLRVLAFVAAFGLVAAACSSSGDDSETSTDDTEDSGDGSTSGDDPTTELDPVAGGELTFLVEADADGYNPVWNRWSISQQFIGSAIYDALAYETGDGDLEMGLAESIEPNEDATVWTITLKPDITFHDGTPLNAEVVKANIDGRLTNPTTSGALEPVEEVVVIDDLTTEVRMSRSWASFNHNLAAQTGYIASFDNAGAFDPAAPAVGTGPFMFVDHVQDSHLTVEKNPAYWDGDVLLDGIRFEIIPDTQARENTLNAGGADGLITNEGSSILSFRDDDDVTSFEHASEATHIMLNTAEPPFDNLAARQAVAYATNPETLLITLGTEDLTVPASTAFISTNPWHLEDNGYPEFDPAMAETLVAQYEDETGETLSFDIMAGQGILTDDASALVEQWGAVGIEATLVPTEQAQLILEVFGGNYQAATFRNFSWMDPDFSYIFWTSNEEGPGPINFTNIVDPTLAEALESGRNTLDPAIRGEAYDQVQLSLNELVPQIWLYETPWAIATQSNVYGFDDAVERGFSRQDAKRFWPDVWVQQ